VTDPRPGERLLDLVAVMDRLRSPGGCPWDAEQTHTSLVEYLVEEAYETVEAIETSDDAALREELGDLLLQVVFHARIAEEHEQPWSIDDVAAGIVDKLVSRHPHVFADVDAATAAEVEANWAALKAAEKGRESVTDGVPAALPALVLAAKLLSRAKNVPVAAVDANAAAAASSAVAGLIGTRGSAESAYGDLLLALVVQARADGVDAEQALRASVRDYRARVRAAEGLEG
jgi:XTP/dITP diphosphohydrolase